MSSDQKPASYAIRNMTQVNYAERAAAGELFTEGQKRDAILSGGIVPPEWCVDIAESLAVGLSLPQDAINDVMLMTAAAARCKPVAELNEREKVALVWVSGGGIGREMDGSTMKLTTEKVGFYNDSEGRVVVVFGPR